ncbi:MAG: hypothetical protein IJM09_04470 [Neisseriaceae bacterium]|nr:hypothetical protein [Neisseriaceae bacterium]
MAVAFRVLQLPALLSNGRMKLALKKNSVWILCLSIVGCLKMAALVSKNGLVAFGIRTTPTKRLLCHCGLLRKSPIGR